QLQCSSKRHCWGQRLLFWPPSCSKFQKNELRKTTNPRPVRFRESRSRVKTASYVDNLIEMRKTKVRRRRRPGGRSEGSLWRAPLFQERQGGRGRQRRCRILARVRRGQDEHRIGIRYSQVSRLRRLRLPGFWRLRRTHRRRCEPGQRQWCS